MNCRLNPAEGLSDPIRMPMSSAKRRRLRYWSTSECHGHWGGAGKTVHPRQCSALSLSLLGNRMTARDVRVEPWGDVGVVRALLAAQHTPRSVVVRKIARLWPVVCAIFCVATSVAVRSRGAAAAVSPPCAPPPSATDPRTPLSCILSCVPPVMRRIAPTRSLRDAEIAKRSAQWSRRTFPLQALAPMREVFRA